jgi:enoyl-CoA hydratase/carnithine racemase
MLMPLVDLSRPIDGVVVMTLNRPDQLNALNRELVEEFALVLSAIARDEECRVVVLTGAGRGFSAGLDLAGYGDEDRESRQGKARGTLTRQREIARLAEQLHRLPQPVIAAVNGPAAGGGLAFVCASDIRIAGDEAVFAVSFIRAGFSACDIGVSWLLPRIVGAGRAHELMLTGRRFDAAEAREIGLVTDVVPQGDLMSAALTKASQITLNAPFGVELTKQGMWIALETPSFLAAIEFENRQQILTAMTEDSTESSSAFLAKREPDYRYR